MAGGGTRHGAQDIYEETYTYLDLYTIQKYRHKKTQKHGSKKVFIFLTVDLKKQIEL